MKQNTVILYQPKVDYKPYYPCFWAPLSILSVAAPLVAKGIEVIILDGNLEQHQQDKEIVRSNISNCLCVGITSMIGGNQLKRSLSFARFIKKEKTEIPIVFGGPLASVIPNQLLSSPEIDYVVYGQGEQPMLDLVNSLINGYKYKKIPGVITRENQDNFQISFLDKNNFPPYPWELIDVEKYIRSDNYLGQRVLNYVSSQGCPYRCGYCSEVAVYKSRWKALSAERVIKEIKWLKQKYSLDGIKFYDANFFAKPKRVIEFVKGLIDNDLRLKWGASAHPNSIIALKNNLSEIKKSGLNRFLVGAESGSQQALNHINKNCSVKDNLRVAYLCAKHCIPVAFTFIVGIPGVKKDILKTLNLALRMKKISREFDIKIHFYAPFPGTSLFKEAQALGYEPPNTLKEWSDYDYYLIQTPWVKKNQEKKVRRFSDFYCDFPYSPFWFQEKINQNLVSSITYKILRRITKIRCKIHCYRFPFEMIWFQKLAQKKQKRGDCK
ncbi:MAG: B12-binding domain-containing radical SAM protein [Candidatus Nealsonbacteria bacterium]